MNANKLTKPRIFMIRKLWYCVTRESKCGMGYTPTHAYDDWFSRNQDVTL